MSNLNINMAYVAGLIFLVINFSCKKGFLEEKADKALLVPQTPAEFQSLLDNLEVMNVVPFYGLVGADDMVISDAGYVALSATLKNAYTWQDEVFEGVGTVQDWYLPYRQIFYSNIILEGLAKIEEKTNEETLISRLKGAALFFRAHAMYQLCQEFAAPYQELTAQTALGLPYPLASDVNIRPGRGTLVASYRQLISDLRAAADLLPEVQEIKSRPGKSAAFALLARIYLIMADYEQAKQCAERALELNGKLINFNTFNTDLSKPNRPFPPVFPNANDEVLFYAAFPANGFLTASILSTTVIDPELFQLYEDADLRRSVFFYTFQGNLLFKGSYSGTSASNSFFAGIATDEIYLVLAECLARLNKKDEALTALNALLLTRWKTGDFISFTASTAEEALKLVLEERRKELVTRGLRWIDLRRLNLNPEQSTTIRRNIQGNLYKLEPNDKRYVLPIPTEEITRNQLEQNPRE
jgi:tetratricopeptide (TPR) repeat protein